MTTKERLHQLVDELDDESADRLLDAALALAPAPAAPPATPTAGGEQLESFIGCFRSGHADTAERAEEILRAEIGGQAAS